MANIFIYYINIFFIKDINFSIKNTKSTLLSVKC